MFYTGNMGIYVGTQPEGRYKISKNPADVGERLFEPISGSGRNVIFGNWFTSYELSVKILADCRLRITFCENKRQIPLRGREREGLFRFQENVRYCHTYLKYERRQY
jgi:hypothetical protein